MATTQDTSAIDRVKKILAVGLVILAVGLFYYFAEESLLFRVLGMVAAVLIAVSIFATTEQGQGVAVFLKDARVELRKMIWPNKTETSQTTLIVIVAVIIVALFLWLVDLFLRWFMQLVIQ